jgi:Lon protease-like protein
MDLPLFPLHTVLCPGIALPLHVFEPRYRLMIERCLAADSPFGVLWIREGREVGTGSLAVAAVGTMAEIREADRHADGRYDLITVGTRRFRVEEVITDREPYLVGRVEPVAEVLVDEAHAGRLARIVTRRFVRYVAQVRDLDPTDEESEVDPDDDPTEDLEPSGPTAASPGDAGPTTGGDPAPATEPVSLTIPADPTLLSHLLSGIVELDLPRRQALLEAPTTEERLTSLADLLAQEAGFLRQQLRVFTPDTRQAASRRN